MARYVLKRQSGAAASLKEVGHLDGIHVLDRHGDVLALVVAEPEIMERHLAALLGWNVAREIGYELPAVVQPPVCGHE